MREGREARALLEARRMAREGTRVARAAVVSLAVVSGCWSSWTADDPCGEVLCPDGDADADGDVDADVDVDVDADVDGDVDGDLDSDVDGDLDGDGGTVEPHGCPACDGEMGIVGAVCRNDRQCELEQGDHRLLLTCIDEETYGFPDGYCAGIPSLAAPYPCDPDDDDTCPADHCGRCVVDDANGVSYCMRACEANDDNWSSSNCGCRNGYQCDFFRQYCVPGCRTEEPGESEDCCSTWVDEDGDGYLDRDERVPVEGCEATCDESTFRCTQPGTDGAAIGDPCSWDGDCPEHGRCVLERGTPDEEDDRVQWQEGYCVLDACELEGRGCLGDARCVELASAGMPFLTCYASCTIADERIGDRYADHNPGCRDGYGCRSAGDADDTGDGACVSLAENLTAVRFCDTRAYPGTGCPETQRCVDDVCQPPCDDMSPCADDVECIDGYCAWSNVGGPCARPWNEPGDPAANDAACVSPYGQGYCAVGAVFGTDGACVIASCEAAGMEDACIIGKRCTTFFGEPLCVDECDLPDDDCVGEESCQGEAIGCHAGFACVPVAPFDLNGICVASCSAQRDPDGWCSDTWGDEQPSCNVDTGVCE